MYLQILKKDLRRKRTMNAILLIFIILAATFVSSSANNMTSVITALDNYFEKGEVPDYWLCMTEQNEMERFETFAHEKHYDFRNQKLLQIEPASVTVDGKELEYQNSLCLSQLKDSTSIFNQEDEEITSINDGDIYLTNNMFHSSDNKFTIGSKINISANGKTKSFTVKGSTKDAMYNSPMLGMTRFLISENDYSYFDTTNSSCFYSIYIYTDDKNFMDKMNPLNLKMAFSTNYSGIKTTYIMDTVIAAVMLLVSVCLILISMVILRFTINFTMSEEFREIGVMKAIGIGNSKIRGLYIVKYFAISVVGSLIGLVLSIPFSHMMLRDLSENIILANSKNYILNVFCAFLVAAIVVMFCYFCTRKIKHFSPIDAIRNGENGERYSRKGFIHLSKSKIPPIPFMAINDILSGLKRYAAMILIFTLGILLIIIPINTINTLQSDHLITWFNMAECDHVISKESIFNGTTNHSDITRQLTEIKTTLSDKGIKADIFQEVMFRKYISHGKKQISSLSFQGVGDITTDMYEYLEGSAPQNNNEVAISHIVSENINANIGDTVSIQDGNQIKRYIVTAIYQTMNNMGEGIRFYQQEQLDYHYATGSFGIQIKYIDSPNSQQLKERKKILTNLFPDYEVHTAGSYIDEMIGNVAEQLQSIKKLILLVVLCINVLMTVLMIRSFLTKEKGEIATLKAIGFKNSSLVIWQTLRIGIVLFLSVVIGVLLSTPLSEVSAGQVFKIMGAQSIEFAIVPLEVYVIYPSIILLVTVIASILAALRICKISAADAANLE